MKKTTFCLLLCFWGTLISVPVFGQVVVGFGDSITAGYPYHSSSGNGTSDGGYQPYLKNLLGTPYSVLNYGVGGETTLNGISRISSVIQAHPGSTMLILEGVNDLGYGLSWSTVRYNLRLMIDRCRNANIIPIIGTLSPTEVVKNNTHNADIRRIAAARGVKVADIWPALNPNWGNLNVDNLHPNKEGYKIMANTWYNAILAETPLQQPPILSSPKAVNIQEVTASFSARVNPNGDPTTAYYEYGATVAYGQQTETIDLGGGFFNEELVVDIQELKPNTEYHFRLMAVNSRGEAISNDNSFRTEAATGPYVTTEPTDQIGSKGSNLNGLVTPNGFQTEYFFQYGPTKEYGMETEHFDAGSGAEEISVSVRATGLTPETIYHCRLVAVGNSNTVAGQDAEFMTTKSKSGGCFIQSALE